MTWQPYDPCTCGCGVVGWKLTRLLPGDTLQHVVGCSCRRHINKRNRKKGQAAEARRHRNLGGDGRTPRDELAHCYSLNVTTEDKTGAQIPAKFRSFVESETARHWFAQAEKKMPIGNDAFPALYLEITPGNWFLVVKGQGRSLR